MTLQEILYKVHIRSVHGRLDIEVKDLQLDSRKVGKGSAFIAVKGTHTDGHEFIESVVVAFSLLPSFAKQMPSRLRDGHYIYSG